MSKELRQVQLGDVTSENTFLPDRLSKWIRIERSHIYGLQRQFGEGDQSEARRQGEEKVDLSTEVKASELLFIAQNDYETVINKCS
jgi:hypothetical protein